MDNDFRKFERKLRHNGYYVVRVTGSHYIFKNKAGKEISINHRPNRMIMKRVSKENALV